MPSGPTARECERHSHRLFAGMFSSERGPDRPSRGRATQKRNHRWHWPRSAAHARGRGRAPDHAFRHAPHRGQLCQHFFLFLSPVQRPTHITFGRLLPDDQLQQGFELVAEVILSVRSDDSVPFRDGVVTMRSTEAWWLRKRETIFRAAWRLWNAAARSPALSCAAVISVTIPSLAWVNLLSRAGSSVVRSSAVRRAPAMLPVRA
jgi:hypothetical protein